MGWRPNFKAFAAVVDYPFRSAETIAGLLRESDDLPTRWAAVAKQRRIVSVAGAASLPSGG